jgi:hypothetical protein
VVQGRRRNLQLTIRQTLCIRNRDSQLTEPSGHRHVEREHGEGGEDSLLDMAEVCVPIARLIGTAIQLGDGHGTR